MKSPVSDSRLTELSKKYWAVGFSEPFDVFIVNEVFQKDIVSHNCPHNININPLSLHLLDLTSYLENYLWPNFGECHLDNKDYLFSLVLLINEKFSRETMTPFSFLNPEKDDGSLELFSQFFTRLIGLFESCSLGEKACLLRFFLHIFQSLEEEFIRKLVLPLVSLPLWLHIPSLRRDKELEKAGFVKHFSVIQNKPTSEKECRFLLILLDDFFRVLDEHSTSALDIVYFEYFLSFLIDLLSQLPTRRFVYLFIDAMHVVERCNLAPIFAENRHLAQFLKMFVLSMDFNLNYYTGEPYTDAELFQNHCEKINNLQRVAFATFPELKQIALTSISKIENREALKTMCATKLTPARLLELLTLLGLINPEENIGHSLAIEVFLNHYAKKTSHLEEINSLPLYPTEDFLWDNSLQIRQHSYGTILPLPKLTLQFLSFSDYLLRNFTLYKLESTFQIVDDLERCIRRMNPRLVPGVGTSFDGFSRMALPVKDFQIKDVFQPKVGEFVPKLVTSELVIDLKQTRKPEIRQEWCQLRRHDVVFLLTIRAKVEHEQSFDRTLPFHEAYGIEFVRGGEIDEIWDEENNVIRDFEVSPTARSGEGDLRRIRLILDSFQYQQDLSRGVGGCYDTFNLVIRRKPKENNFKAVLHTIRSLMNTQISLPSWLHDTFLGYGDPTAPVAFSNISPLTFNDSFVDLQHFKDTYPDKEVNILGDSSPGKRYTYTVTETPTSVTARVEEPPSNPLRKIKHNSIHFTHIQIEAIRRGLNEGLTLVVGPPGTGKTDVAVQIINNIYHNHSNQRTLIVTHSNQALNQIFDKIIQLDIDERHCIRLGHGEEMLETEKDFSRYGRVDHMLELRLNLLKQVKALAASLEDHRIDPESVSQTCSVANNFFLLQVLSRWEKFCSLVHHDPAAVSHFPFAKFFPEIPVDSMEVAKQLFSSIHDIFDQLEETSAFELLRNPVDRANYLLTKQSKIVAMTCTHAALKRGDLLKMDFRYDNLIMEEAAQLLEIENFIPMLCQKEEEEKQGSRLKRVILIGDHHQLPPILKNKTLSKYCHFDQSLFTRLIRLKVPYLELDVQGRCRSSLSELFRWRYDNLGNLPLITQNKEFHLANGGFVYDYQMVSVDDYESHGETEPSPHYFQNLGEAEYLVHVYMYMRLFGYPREKISIITTYNGQKDLIKDICNYRCRNNPLFGLPKRITTVDHFQGQQNDYILLSLVRTNSVGHFRDVRRLVVAMSRARLGLYVFCRPTLFETFHDLSPVFQRFRQRPDKLHLVPNEFHPTTRGIDDDPPQNIFPIENVHHMMKICFEVTQKRMKEHENNNDMQT